MFSSFKQQVRQRKCEILIEEYVKFMVPLFKRAPEWLPTKAQVITHHNSAINHAIMCIRGQSVVPTRDERLELLGAVLSEVGLLWSAFPEDEPRQAIA